MGSIVARLAAACAVAVALFNATAQAQPRRCDIPTEARDIWRCERGFVVGPEDVIIRLAIPESDPEALYNAGIEAARREDWHAAIAYFTAAHQRAHLVPRYMYNLALAHARAGHEAPAIGWFAAYLVAAPNAGNREEIWRQIAELERDAYRASAELWHGSLAAASTLPAGDRREGLIRRINAQQSAANAARSAAPAGPAPPPLLPETGITPDFVNPSIRDTWGHAGGPILDAARDGGAVAMAAAARPLEAATGEDDRASAYAALGRGALAISWARTQTSGGFDGFYAEGVRSEIAEVLLHAGDLQNAAIGVDLANGADIASPWRGILGARIRALFLAQSGSPAAGIEHLQVFYSRRFTASNGFTGTFAPSHRWSQARFDAIGQAAEHLLRIGRFDEALTIAADLDTLRRMRFADWALSRQTLSEAERARMTAFRASSLQAACGAADMCPADALRTAIEAQISATMLFNGSYDLRWWLALARRGRPNVPAEYRVPGQAEDIAAAADDIELGLVRVKAAYAHNGGTWGVR